MSHRHAWGWVQQLVEPQLFPQLFLHQARVFPGAAIILASGWWDACAFGDYSQAML